MVSVHPRIVNDYNVVTRSLWLVSHVEGWKERCQSYFKMLFILFSFF